jgi:ankyrin repeat protein
MGIGSWIGGLWLVSIVIQPSGSPAALAGVQSRTAPTMGSNAIHELMKQARKGHLGRIERLLGKGVDLNARAGYGQTALFEAVFSQQVETVRFLLEHGADPRLVSDDGAGPLFYACVSGNLEIVELLIQYGADVNEVRRSEYRC